MRTAAQEEEKVVLFLQYFDPEKSLTNEEVRQTALAWFDKLRRKFNLAPPARNPRRTVSRAKLKSQKRRLRSILRKCTKVQDPMSTAYKDPGGVGPRPRENLLA